MYLPTSIWELASNGKYRKQFIPCQRSKVILKDDKIRISSIHQSAWKPPPPLLAQKCNGTIAGLGYMEVSVDCPWKFQACAVVHVRTGSIPDGGEDKKSAWKPNLLPD